jgi:hypothetical protein
MTKVILILLLTLTINAGAVPPRSAPENFKMVNGVIYDIKSPGSRWRELHAEATGLHTNGSIVRQIGFQDVRSRDATTVRAKVYGVTRRDAMGPPPGTVIGKTKVYGSTIFLIGHKMLLGQVTKLTAMPIGQANINGVMMEVWKGGTTPTIEQVRAWQLTNQTN